MLRRLSGDVLGVGTILRAPVYSELFAVKPYNPGTDNGKGRCGKVSVCHKCPLYGLRDGDGHRQCQHTLDT